jgi:sugar lactone lactonase YvrE
MNRTLRYQRILLILLFVIAQTVTAQSDGIASGPPELVAGDFQKGTVDGQGLGARFQHPSNITSDGKSLYVVDFYNKTIRKIAVETGAVSTLAGSTKREAYANDTKITDGTGDAALFAYPGAIATDGVFVFVADYYGSTIRKIEIETGVVTTLFGSIERTKGLKSSHDIVDLVNVAGLATDGTDLFFSEQNMLKKLRIANGEISRIAGTPETGSADGTGSQASFNNPQGICLVGGSILVADTGNNLIRKVDLGTGKVTTIAGSGSSGEVDGIGTRSKFNGPTSLTSNGKDVLVNDSGNNCIRRIELESGSVTTVKALLRTNTADYKRQQSFLFSLEKQDIVEVGDYVFVTDDRNNRIWRTNIQTAESVVFAGSDSFGSRDGIGSGSGFSDPFSLVVNKGSIYVTDDGSLRRIDIASHAVTTLATSIGRGYGITSDGQSVFLSIDNRIQRYALNNGRLTALAGGPRNGSANGIGELASFSSPGGIASDGVHVFVADTQNNLIRSIDIKSGLVRTLAGSGQPFANDGKGIEADFSSPTDVATDGTFVFVADSGNKLIRKVVIKTGEVTTIAKSVSVRTIATDGKAVYFADTSNSISRIDRDGGEISLVMQPVKSQVEDLSSEVEGLSISKGPNPKLYFVDRGYYGVFSIGQE